jgi:hypothetical protein
MWFLKLLSIDLSDAMHLGPSGGEGWKACLSQLSEGFAFKAEELGFSQ